MLFLSVNSAELVNSESQPGVLECVPCVKSSRHASMNGAGLMIKLCQCNFIHDVTLHTSLARKGQTTAVHASITGRNLR